MPTILIADACKPSLVMSSEVFKDKIAGANILVATSGKQCLELVTEHKPDMCVVDFDLPDTDGVTLITALRKVYRGPVLLTAFPDEVVKQAVANDLFVYNDSGAWIPKPVKFDELSAKIDQFLLDQHRLGRRFTVDLETLVIGKGAGRGKRAPKATGRIINMSLGGLCIQMDEPFKMKKSDEMTIALPLTETLEPPTKPGKKAQASRKTTAKGKARAGAKKDDAPETRIKCTVCWFDRKTQKAGFAFNRLTDSQRKGLEAFLRESVVS